LGEGLKENNSLQQLHLAKNNIGAPGAQAPCGAAALWGRAVLGQLDHAGAVAKTGDLQGVGW